MKNLRSHKWLNGPQETALLHQGALRAVGIDRISTKDNLSSELPTHGRNLTTAI